MSVELLKQKVTTFVGPKSIEQEAPTDDSFRYGWRIVIEPGDDGETIRYISLTQADFLDPQPGDQMVQSDKHFQLVQSLYDRFNKRYLAAPSVGVFSDVKMVWGIPGLKGPAPDLAIVPNLRTKGQEHTSFHVMKEGTRPCLIVEVVSPHYPGDDNEKVVIYERAGVQEYIIIHPHFEDESLEFELTGYHLIDGQYQKMVMDEWGRLLSETTRMWFELDESGRELILTDADAGERFLTDEEEYEARLAAEARAEAEAYRAEVEANARQAAEAEIARLKVLLEQRDNSTSL